MRILMISDVYFPRINGVSTSTQIFREELLRRGHKVTLIAPHYPNCAQEDDIIRIASRQVLFDPEDRMMKARDVMALLPMLRSEHYDLLHIQTPFIAHHLGVKLAAALNIPSIETYHTFFEEYLFHYVPFVPKRWMRALARYFTRKQCNAVDSVIVPSTAMSEILEHYGVTTPMKIIPTGMELDKFHGCNGAAFRQRYAISAQRPTLVHIGRVAHEKNIGFLLRMLQQLRKSLPEILLIIAGEGPALPHLRKQTSKLGLNNNVLFVGYLSRADALGLGAGGEHEGITGTIAIEQGIGTRQVADEQNIVTESELACLFAQVWQGRTFASDDQQNFRNAFAQLLQHV